MAHLSSHDSAMVYSLVMLAILGGMPFCLGWTIGERSPPFFEDDFGTIQHVTAKKIAATYSEIETKNEVEFDAPQTYNLGRNVEDEFPQDEIVENNMEEIKITPQKNGKQLLVLQINKEHNLRQKKEWLLDSVTRDDSKPSSNKGSIQITKEQNRLNDESSLDDTETERDSNRKTYLESLFHQWLISIFGGNKPGGNLDLDNGVTTVESWTHVTDTSEGTSETMDTSDGDFTDSTEEATSEWIDTTQEVTTTTTTTMEPTTTVKTFADYCKIGCKDGTAGPECGCPEHPIG